MESEQIRYNTLQMNWANAMFQLHMCTRALWIRSQQGSRLCGVMDSLCLVKYSQVLSFIRKHFEMCFIFSLYLSFVITYQDPFLKEFRCSHFKCCFKRGAVVDLLSTEHHFIWFQTKCADIDCMFSWPLPRRSCFHCCLFVCQQDYAENHRSDSIATGC